MFPQGFELTKCDHCNKVITPRRYAAYSSYKRINETASDYCCGPRRDTADDWEYASAIPYYIFKKRRSKTIRYTMRVAYVIEQLLPTSWIANMLYIGEIIPEYHGAVFGMNSKEQFYLRYTENKGKDTERQRVIVGRPVRLLKKVFGKEMAEQFPDELWEEFHNELYARIKDTYFDWEIVEGEDIKKWYHYSTYADGTGSLESSCMRYERCQDYFDIYVKNPKQVKMLIAVSKITRKLHGRALLFTLSDGTIFMSRAYGSDVVTRQFKNYAEKEGWLSYAKGEYYDKYVQLDESNFDSYPYMDAFQNLDKKNDRLYSSWQTGMIVLEDTNGNEDEYYEDE